LAWGIGASMSWGLVVPHAEQGVDIIREMSTELKTKTVSYFV
jgi:hypothetical protein